MGKNGKLLREYEDDFCNEYEFLIKLPSVQTKFREIMQTLDFSYKTEKGEVAKANLFTYCLQEFGNRIRHHGNIEKEEIKILVHALN